MSRPDVHGGSTKYKQANGPVFVKKAGLGHFRLDGGGATRVAQGAHEARPYEAGGTGLGAATRADRGYESP